MVSTEDLKNKFKSMLEAQGFTILESQHLGNWIRIQFRVEDYSKLHYLIAGYGAALAQFGFEFYEAVRNITVEELGFIEVSIDSQ